MRKAARRLAWERLARSLLSCVCFSHRSSSSRPNRSLGSISRTTRYAFGLVIRGIFSPKPAAGSTGSLRPAGTGPHATIVVLLVLLMTVPACTGATPAPDPWRRQRDGVDLPAVERSSLQCAPVAQSLTLALNGCRFPSGYWQESGTMLKLL